jgi:hypothetical protein
MLRPKMPRLLEVLSEPVVISDVTQHGDSPFCATTKVFFHPLDDLLFVKRGFDESVNSFELFRGRLSKRNGQVIGYRPLGSQHVRVGEFQGFLADCFCHFRAHRFRYYRIAKAGLRYTQKGSYSTYGIRRATHFLTGGIRIADCHRFEGYFSERIGGSSMTQNPRKRFGL